MISFAQWLDEGRIRDAGSATKLGVYLAKRHGKTYGSKGLAQRERGNTIMFDKWVDHRELRNAAGATLHKLQNWQVKHNIFNTVSLKNKVGTTSIPLKDLHPTQSGTKFNDLDAHWKMEDKEPIFVAKHEGKHWIVNGHHRYMAHRLRGETHIQAHIVDLDKKK